MDHYNVSLETEKRDLIYRVESDFYPSKKQKAKTLERQDAEMIVKKLQKDPCLLA